MVSLAELGVRPGEVAALIRTPYISPDALDYNNSMGNGVKAGDFAFADHAMRVEVVNAAIRNHIDAVDAAGGVSPVVEQGCRLAESLVQFREHVANPDNYQAGALATIHDRFATVGEQGGRSMKEWVTDRIAQFPGGFRITTDIDGTLTSNHEGPDSYLFHIPGSKLAEPLLAEHGRDQFPHIFTKTWGHVLNHAPHLIAHAAEYAELREGVHELTKAAHEAGVPATVISANFQPLAGRIAERAFPEGSSIDVFAVTQNNILPTDKGILLRHITQQDPDRAVIYFGDGGSDLPTLEARDVVACYFALEGSSFAKALQLANLPHFTYKDFRDIHHKLQEMQLLPAA